MRYVSEILKILDGALRHSTDQAERYAGLLASKLEADGESDQARLIRERLAKIPRPAISGQLTRRLPLDQDSRGVLIDEDEPRSVVAAFDPLVQQSLDEFSESVVRNDELRAAGVDLAPRLLLYGPPGCGKTLAARLIAQRLTLPLLTVRCDAIVSSLLGQTGRNLREVFDHAAGRPCVLFLDEFDALAKARSSVGEVGELQRVVIALLQSLDSLGSDTVVIAATNHHELLDPAIWRRFSLLVPMELPAVEQRAQLWEIYLAGRDLPATDLQTLADLSTGMSGAAIKTAANDIVRDCVLRGAGSIALPQALVRLARIKWLGEEGRPRGLEEEIRALRAWAPKVFTWKAVESTFNLSGRKVKNLLGDQDDRPRKAGSAGSHRS